ncbi:Ras modification protein ERF4 [Pseudocercospora fuligena]|uniref:Ras modification protein ERF4 n=1 Tax=Pseudocercospora fuligena TaxID=685502 RepID=A0A8H6RJ18_9PEZI|nr:Ras modification protein ERF4 [Pseudocercospora fuligena]
MNALHKIAGVQEADSSSPTPPVPQPTIVTQNYTAISQPPPIPPKDDRRDNTDARSIVSATSGKRAPLPLNRRRSQKSFKSGRSGHSQSRSEHTPKRDPKSLGPVPAIPALPAQRSQISIPQTNRTGVSNEGAEAAEDDDFEWGPQHPCFPHPNPHCSPSSEEFDSTRVIRVKRDWLIAGDLYPQYANLYPEILDPLITDEEFRSLIADINSILQSSFSPFTWRAWFDSILGVLTGYIYDDLGFTGAKRGEKALETYIDDWNGAHEVEGRDVKMIQLRRTGFMSLDFVIPDPQIDAPAEEEEDEQEVEGVLPAE